MDKKRVDWDDVRGIAPDATGDLSSEEFIRRLRDEWPDRQAAIVGMSPEEWELEKAMARAAMTPEIEEAIAKLLRRP